MNPPAPATIVKLLAASKIAAERAGASVRNIYKNLPLNVVEKGIDDLQTECDRNAQEIIVDHLTRLFPGVNLVTEEPIVEGKRIPETQKYPDFDEDILRLSYADNVRDDEITVWVDPVDGTSSLVKGNLQSVTILIGIAHRQSPVAGVIHCPFAKDTDDLVFGSEGVQNWSTSFDGHTIWALLGHGIVGLKTRPPPRDRVLTSSESHWKNVESALKSKEIINRLKPSRILHLNGCAYKMLSTITGVSDLYVYPTQGLKKWDTCAPEAILRLAGGFATDCSEHPQTIDYWCQEKFADEATKLARCGLSNGIIAGLNKLV